MTHAARLLLVEPGGSALAVLARRLGDAGYNVISCADPGQALAELRREPADLVIAEARMKPIGGAELTRIIRDHAALAELPILIIAGKSDAAGAIECLEAGADDVIAKPFDSDVLLARVARQLRRARSLAALREDKAVLDARVTERAIELGEVRAALKESEAERERLQRMVKGS